MGVFKRLFATYLKTLNTYPRQAQAVQAGLLMGAGDVISQTVIEKKEFKNLDKLRIIKFTSIGFFVGPFLQTWYTALARITSEGSKLIVTVKKVVIDQTVAAPFVIFSILSVVYLSDGYSIEETKEQLKKNYFDVILTNYKIWPVVQILNFGFVPLNFQVLVAQIVALFWNTYLSYKTHQKLQ